MLDRWGKLRFNSLGRPLRIAEFSVDNRIGGLPQPLAATVFVAFELFENVIASRYCSVEQIIQLSVISYACFQGPDVIELLRQVSEGLPDVPNHAVSSFLKFAA